MKHKITIIVLLILAVYTANAQQMADGAHKTYFENGKLKEDFKFKKGKKIGNWKSYFSSGKLHFAAQYIDGKPTGIVLENYLSGTIKSIKSYQNGIPFGTWKYFNKDTKLAVSCTFDNHKITIKHYRKGKVYKAYYITNAHKKEEWKTHTENGVLSLHFYSGLEAYLQKEYYVEDMKHTVFPTKFLDNAAEIYEKNKNINGLLDAKLVQYYKGEELIRFESNCVAGKLNGETKGYYKNGNIMYSGQFEKGLKSGTWIKYNEAGEISKKGSYIDGEKNGRWTVSHQDGNVEEVTIYANDTIVSTNWTYYFNGKIRTVDTDIDEHKRASTLYHSNGKVYKTRITNNGLLETITVCQNKYGKALNKGTVVNGTGLEYEYTPAGKLMNIVHYSNGKIVTNSFSIDTVWNDWMELNNYAWNIYENASDTKRLKQAIIWIKRSIELEESYANLDTYAALLYKTGNYRQALAMAQKAITNAKDSGYEYEETNVLIKKINQKLD